MAVWDTGATGSVITQSIVDHLQIEPITMTIVHGVNTSAPSLVYLVDFYLPMNVVVSGLNVTLAKLVGIDLLIGMDVINMGDFAITNRGGKTKMSFRMPSQADIDYVKEVDNQGMSRAQRRARDRNRSR
jgi:hypothetical protein